MNYLKQNKNISESFLSVLSAVTNSQLNENLYTMFKVKAGFKLRKYNCRRSDRTRKLLSTNALSNAALSSSVVERRNTIADAELKIRVLPDEHASSL